MTARDVVLTGEDELRQWAAALATRRPPIRLRLDLPTLTPLQREQWQRRFERLHNDCGCSAAALALLSLVVAVAAYAALIGFEQPLWVLASATLVGAIASIFVGKALGHAWSRRQLRAEVAKLLETME